jgi:hypothetical protein
MSAAYPPVVFSVPAERQRSPVARNIPLCDAISDAGGILSRMSRVALGEEHFQTRSSPSAAGDCTRLVGGPHISQAVQVAAYSDIRLERRSKRKRKTRKLSTSENQTSSRKKSEPAGQKSEPPKK